MILDFLWYCKALQGLTGVQVTPVKPEFLEVSNSVLKNESIFHIIFKPEDPVPQELYFDYILVDPTNYKDYADNSATRNILSMSKEVFICHNEGTNKLDLTQDDRDLLETARQQIANNNFSLVVTDTNKEWLKHSILYWRYKLLGEETYQEHIALSTDSNISKLVSYISCFQQLQDALQNDIGELE